MNLKLGTKRSAVAFFVAGIACVNPAFAGGGPLGIDSKLNYDDHGIWKRSNQKALETLVIGGQIAGALWLGSDTELGKTFWQSVDASLIGGAGYLVLNNTFRRLRPSQTDDPNQWGKHGGHSFPSGEVTSITSAITPFILEYGSEHPMVYALELIPLYDAEARMKVQGHWQTDVLGGYILGSLAGYYAHSRKVPFTVMVLPHALTVGWSTKF